MPDFICARSWIDTLGRHGEKSSLMNNLKVGEAFRLGFERNAAI